MDPDLYRVEVQRMLGRLAEAMADAGLSRELVEKLFTGQISVADHPAPEVEALDEDLRDTLDRITGWCLNKIVFKS